MENQGAFVEQIASYVHESGIDLQNWLIVLPSERPKQYILKALYEKYQRPVFAPDLLTIDQWMKQLSPKPVLDKTRILIELYHVHLELAGPEEDRSFDDFLNWGQLLVNDFDEIDRYLVDPKLLFRNLRDIKEIENWSFGEDRELTENQKKYLAFWEKLPKFHEKLHQKLQKRNALMMGSVYRLISEEIDRVFEEKKELHVLFAGFNALSLSEMTLIRQLHRMGRGHILMNADHYYLDDPNHEAGFFLRKLRDHLQVRELPLVQKNIGQQALDIEVVSCAQQSGQIKLAASQLAQMSPEEISGTLLLLADESLILPLLQNIPKSVGKANITLGLPIQYSSLKTWVNLIFSIQEGFIRHRSHSIYYKDLFQCWKHPLFRECLNEEEIGKIHARELEMRSRNIVYQSLKRVRISEKADEVLDTLYTPWKNDWSLALEQIRKLNRLLFDALSEKHRFERAILQQFDQSLTDFQNMVHEENFPEMNLGNFRKLFQLQWGKQRIAYFGNPMDGLQIMGLLETRLLDFERIIVLGLNEGKMPPDNEIQSLIPMDLRRYVGLPTPRDKQGLFAHHFYRLLHRAKHLTLCYHQGAEGFGYSEKSRFISQLEMEMATPGSRVKLVQKDYTLESSERINREKSIQKTDVIIDRLDELFASGTSVSMLKNYFRCSLDFYYKYVLEFGEEEQVEEEMESNTFGTIIHHVLEQLYDPYCLERHEEEYRVPALNVDILDDMLKRFEGLLHKAFKQHFNDDEQAFMQGKNFLSYQVSRDLIRRFLKSEKKYLRDHPGEIIRVKGLESRLETELSLNIHGVEKRILLKGFVDRIDLVNDSIRIIDYKSGRVHLSDVGKSSSRSNDEPLDFLCHLSKESKYFFQLLTYAFLYHRNHHVLPSESCIISFVSTQENPFKMHALDFSNMELIEKYPEILQKLLSEIYDPETFFQHTRKFPMARFCSYCN
ncbi:MAG: PD-(D/E)XK nuclease family protein [Bacteroidetes bacterium]|nr:MAG: PD-(D/E)XK nuclease family protein [Bacteroidota bacterium]